MEVYLRWERGTLYVSDLMSKPVRTASELASIPTLVSVMARYEIGCLVVTRRGRPVGIVTKGDILRRGISKGLDLMSTSAAQLMSSHLITIGEDATIEAAAELMAKNSVKRLPVVRQEKLIGIITAIDIVRKEPALVRLLDELTPKQRSAS